jgi:hypothetical protein
MLEFKTTEPKVQVPADHITLMAVFDLTPLEAKLLQAMLVGGWVGAREVPDAAASFRQIVFTLRGKMERLHAVTIVNNGGGKKYAMPIAAKKIVAQALEKVTRES